MAEGWSSSVLCRYYLNGCCRGGASCRFSHDRQNSQSSMACRFYLKGHCSYGDRCRYDHVRLPSTVASTDTNNQTNRNASRVSTSETSPNSTLSNNSTSFNTRDIGNKTILRKANRTDNSATRHIQDPLLCADAPEFVPESVNLKSYAEVTADSEDKENCEQPSDLKESDLLCPFAMMGECRYGDQCAYIHGDICDMCTQACLHPTDVDQRKQHKQECTNAHERDMEHSFAVARSKDKICTICMDVIMEKLPHSERRFGILPNCNHIFCLSCIRRWRSTKQIDNKTVRSCPQCRTPSDFVTPSNFWCENEEDKNVLIESYKKALSLKSCKYFKEGNGECPFAGNCFYLHAYPDGRKATLPPPRPRRRRNADGDLEIAQQLFLWNYVDERESRWFLQFEMDDSVGIFGTDSDTSSNYSDFDS
ncbi:putative E3 ubiquitin-protein ligase makorin-2 [Chamberlinius hualienensis]